MSSDFLRSKTLTAFSPLGELFLRTSGRVPRKTWWLGLAFIVFAILILAALSTYTAIYALAELNGRNVIVFYKFSSWLTLFAFLLAAYPLYAISIKRRRDRNHNGWDLKLCFLLNFIVVLGHAVGMQWLLNYGGIGFAMKEAANTPGLIVPTVSPEIQYFTLLINLFTLYILIPLGLFAGVESPLEGGARSLPSGQTPRYIHYGLLGSSMAIAAGFVGILVSQDEEEKIVIGEPLPSHMAAMMQTIPSGKEGRVGNIIVRPSATVRNKRGQHCRSFTAVAETNTVAVVCWQNGQWITTFAAINNSQRILEESRMAHFKAIGASSPFSEEGERLTLGFQ